MSPMSKKKKPERPSPASLGLPLVGVDTHAHLDMHGLDEDLPGVLTRALAAGVARIGQVCQSVSGFHAIAAKLAACQDSKDPRPEIFFILGVHPHEAADCEASGDVVLSEMEALIRAEPRIRAVGETGLDFFYDRSPRDAQARVFARHLELARAVNLPPVIHSRDAAAETIAILEDLGFRDRPVLWHCFGGGPGLAAEILSRGWTVSLAGPVSYKKNEDSRAAAAMIPLDRLVLETDCPFLAPEPWRGQRNEPALAAFTAHSVAAAREVDPADLWRATGETAVKFFGL